MALPLTSVVIPTYNRAHCVADTIDSALAQTYTNLEVVVLDDGSTDATAELIERRYGDDPRVRYFRTRNGGVARARNVALSQTRGELIALLDSDDVWVPWKLELQVACMLRHPELGMTWTDMRAVDGSGAVLSERFLRQRYTAWRHWDDEQLFARREPLRDICPRLAAEVGDATLGIGELFTPMITGNLVHTSTVVLRRDRLDKVGGFRVDLLHAGEDYDFHLRTCREGSVGLVDVPSMTYLFGTADQLTSHKYDYWLKANFLKTLAPILATDRDKIALPQEILDEVLAEGHRAFGEVLLNQGRREEASRELLASLRLKPAQPRVAWLLLNSKLPPITSDKLRGAVRTARRRLGTRPPV